MAWDTKPVPGAWPASAPSTVDGQPWPATGGVLPQQEPAQGGDAPEAVMPLAGQGFEVSSVTAYDAEGPLTITVAEQGPTFAQVFQENPYFAEQVEAVTFGSGFAEGDGPVIEHPDQTSPMTVGPETFEVAPNMSEEELREDRNNKIQRWLDAKEGATTAAEEEKLSRQIVSDLLFPTPKKGTQRYPLAAGYAVKLVHGWSYTLGEAKVTDEQGVVKTRAQIVEAIIDKVEGEFGERGVELMERLIKWSPELVEKEYQVLDPERELHCRVKELIDEILIVKPASPQLTFEEPKEAK